MPDFPVSCISRVSAEEEQTVLGHGSKLYICFPGEAELRLGFLSLEGIVQSHPRRGPGLVPGRSRFTFRVVLEGLPFFLSGKSHLHSCSEASLLLPVQSCTALLD